MEERPILMHHFQGGQGQRERPRAGNVDLSSFQGQDSAPSRVSSVESEVRDAKPWSLQWLSTL